MTPQETAPRASAEPPPTTAEEWGVWLRPRLERLQRVAAGYYPESPEDLLQATLLTLFRAAARGVQLPGGDALLAYCCTSLRNKAYDWYEERKRRQPISAPVEENTPEPMGDVFSPETLDTHRLREQLQHILPPKQEHIITMRIFAGMTFTEIGSALGISRKTVYARFTKGIQLLKQHFSANE